MCEKETSFEESIETISKLKDLCQPSAEELGIGIKACIEHFYNNFPAFEKWLFAQDEEENI